MTIDDIKRLIAADESRTLELKKSTGELKDGMHAACAFLNTDGGWLIFGITPTSHKIIGQEVNDNTKRKIAQALAGLNLYETKNEVRLSEETVWLTADQMAELFQRNKSTISRYFKAYQEYTRKW